MILFVSSPGIYSASGKNDRSSTSSCKKTADKETCRSLGPCSPRTESEILSSPNLKAFTFNELRSATKNFRPDSFLGEGGFGCVYKGWIDEQTLAASRPGVGTVVAVKMLRPEGFQGHKEWLVCSFSQGNVFLSFWGLASLTYHWLVFAVRTKLSGSTSSPKSGKAYWILCWRRKSAFGLWVYA